MENVHNFVSDSPYMGVPFYLVTSDRDWIVLCVSG